MSLHPPSAAGPRVTPEAKGQPPIPMPRSGDRFVLPELPSVPDTLPAASGTSTSASDEIDFDDLSRRFEELKKKT